MAQTGSVIGALLLGSLFLVAMMPDRPAQPEAQATPAKQADSLPSETVSSATRAPTPEPASIGGPEPSPQMIVNSYGHISIQRSPDSHFYVDAEVNGTTVHFLVDTGATGIVLTPSDADRARVSGDDFTVTAMSAGGEIQLMPAIADRVALGPLVASDVPVLVAKDKLSISLLGQSYLSRVGTVSISGDTMTLQ